MNQTLWGIRKWWKVVVCHCVFDSRANLDLLLLVLFVGSQVIYLLLGLFDVINQLSLAVLFLLPSVKLLDVCHHLQYYMWIVEKIYISKAFNSAKFSRVVHRSPLELLNSLHLWQECIVLTIIILLQIFYCAWFAIVRSLYIGSVPKHIQKRCKPKNLRTKFFVWQPQLLKLDARGQGNWGTSPGRLLVRPRLGFSDKSDLTDKNFVSRYVEVATPILLDY